MESYHTILIQGSSGSPHINPIGGFDFMKIES